MRRPLTVMHALDKSRATTGSVVQMLEAVRGLARRGHRVTVVGRPGGDLEAAAGAAGAAFLALALRHAADLPSALAWRRRLTVDRPDIVHVHKGRPHALALVAATGLGRRPVIVVNRGVSFPLDVFNRWKYRHPRVGAVVCVAEAVRTVLIRSGGLRPERVVTIHGGTDTDRFDPGLVDAEAVRRELGLDRSCLLVGQVSVRDWKGWNELVAAVAAIAPRRPELRLVLVGCEGTEDAGRVTAAARAHGVADRVLTLPYRRDMPEVLAACDIVADASWAGTGITGTVREAMAMARAVVATDVGGNAELIVDGVSGFLVPPRDTAALASALERLAADRELRRRLGAAGGDRVRRQFSTERRVERLEALYHACLDSAAD